MEIFKEIKFDKKGLVVAIAQDYKTKVVLMQAFMNKEALQKTIETGQVHYFSRSRNKLWLKGEESGHFQTLKEIKVDCDNDSILVKVEQKEVACHTGHYSCFFTKIENDELIEEKKMIEKEDEVSSSKSEILNELYELISERKKNPKEGSYTNYLFDKGVDKICKKVGEESAEVIIASKNDSKDEVKYEVADLVYHLLVLLVDRKVEVDEVYNELIKRKK